VASAYYEVIKDGGLLATRVCAPSCDAYGLELDRLGHNRSVVIFCEFFLTPN